MTEKDIIDKYLGIPYEHKGRNLAGLDCYGLIIAVYSDLGIRLFDIEEDYDREWSWKNKNYFLENCHKDWKEIKQARLFDIVGFNNSKEVLSHAGIMLDKERFINTCPKVGTVICRLSDGKWGKRFAGFYRHKGLTNDIL